MGKKIKRNELDYLITDILPVEVPEIFTLGNFYKFLNTKSKDLKFIEQKINHERYNQGIQVFDRWHAMPLKFNIYKSHGSSRELSLLNPFSMLEVYFFVKIYNESLLNSFSDNRFSLRYHSGKSTLYYVGKDNGFLLYGDTENESFDIETLEATGLFFDINQYSRIKQFFKSEKWSLLNLKYSDFAKIDYQSCFDSIYTHTFKWLISDNVIDSKSYSQTNHLYSVTDRILQHINSSISNGIVVGPEFSRMVAELILQKIDIEVYFRLTELGLREKHDYEIHRYVDDVFVFANDEKITASVLEVYKKYAKKFQLRINDNKTKTGKLPTVWNEWLHEIKEYVNEIETKHFYDKDKSAEKKYRMKTKNMIEHRHLAPLKDNFQRIMCMYEGERDKITRYVLGMYSRKFNRKNEIAMFKEGISVAEVYGILDFVFFHVSYAPSYRNLQLVIILMTRIFELVNYEEHSDSLQKIINKYYFIFEKANINDLQDLLLVIKDKGAQLPIDVELSLWKKVKEEDNPILYAAFLMYVNYNQKFFDEVLRHTEEIIISSISRITKFDEIFLYREIWWIYCFIDCPYISQSTIDAIKDVVDKIKVDNNNTKHMTRNIIHEYLCDDDFCNKFINWGERQRDIASSITYKTIERTIFLGGDDIVSIWEY